jgi:hypothetical protein
MILGSVPSEQRFASLIQANNDPWCRVSEQDVDSKSLSRVFNWETMIHTTLQSPMCQYSSDNGHATDWHMVHIGVSESMLVKSHR